MLSLTLRRPALALFATLTLSSLAACGTLDERFAPPPLDGPYAAIPLNGFSDSINHWRNRHGNDYAKYAPDQIVAIADNVLLYQRDNGGWVENRDPTRILDADEKTAIALEKANATGSFDNRNVYTQIEYLSAVYQQTRQPRYQQAALRGMDFLLSMQHASCGGWPHTVPGTERYHPFITMADEVTSGVLRMLRKAATGSAPFEHLPNRVRLRAQAALERGDACVLKLQVVQNGRLTGWAGQYDPQTLQPAQGRSFELASIVSQETIEMLRYLMSIPSPSPEVIRAVEAGTDWLERSKIRGWRIETFKIDKPVKYDYHTATTDRRLVEDPSAPALWARFYDLQDNSVVLANRDGKRVSRYADIHHERRTGYAWYGSWAARLLDTEYPAWRQRVGLAPSARN